MKQLDRTARMIVAFVAVALVLTATASSAMAVTVEPLNTKFSGSSKNIEFFISASGEDLRCKNATFEGTSESTKVNFVSMTPTFSECTWLGSPVTITNLATGCTKGTIGWTFTFNEAGKATTKLNCELLMVITRPKGENCDLRFKAGSTEKFGSSSWSAVLGLPELKWDTSFSYLGTPAAACEAEFFSAVGELWLAGSVKLTGIKVK